MNERPNLQEALAALGQPGDLAATVAAGTANGGHGADSAAELPGTRRARRRKLLIAVSILVAVLLLAGYWQRQPLLAALERAPLIGPVVRQQRLAWEAKARPDPAQAALAQRERELDERALALAAAESELAAREQLLREQEQALAEREAELERREAAFADSLPGPGIDELIAIYGNMKPDAAADRIARLEDLTAITILQRVDRQLAARILAAMAADRAAELSEALASQGTDLP